MVNLLLALALVALWPSAVGGPLGYVVVSGDSMLPTYSGGDLVVTRTTSSVAIGDVAVFTVPPDEPGAGMSVIHRIASGTAEQGWRTHGDNNPGPDPWVIDPDDIDGVVRAHVPYVGSALLALRTWWALSAAGIAVAAYAGYRVLAARRVHAHEPPNATLDGSERKRSALGEAQTVAPASTGTASATGGSFSMNSSASSSDIDAR